ncbi:Glucose-1-phosphate adenylyltransferase [Clarias magur]|uniref:Glucose-1-phosphate adenylyltransferase n=1 Tax=Clarias magur TaxID=1594786 RepID=A0A8J4U2A6_CLAMG|nr:Glucose-1-phosphate adenylyltransferase [Clarias magur]
MGSLSLTRCVCMGVWSEWKAPLLSNFTTLTGASERLGVIYSHAFPLSQIDSSPMKPL